jgi:hypothetical protein
MADFLTGLRSSLDARLTEFWRPGINRGSYPGTDSETCVFSVCSHKPVWRLIAGDMSEHIARLNYCEPHAIMVAFATSLPCTTCGKNYRIDVREKMS